MSYTRPSTRPDLVLTLTLGTITSTYPQSALAVLSGFLVAEFNLTQSKLGWLFAIFALTGATLSPTIGKAADSRGQIVLSGLFLAGCAALFLTAIASSYLLLVIGMLIGGLALGSGNPITNRIISECVPRRQRGIVIGIKQTGPAIALFLAGTTLPSLANLAGWRAAFAISGLLPVAGLIMASRVTGALPNRTNSAVAAPHSSNRVGVMAWLSIIGGVTAMSLAITIAFLPLYAEQHLNFTPRSAGALAASMGIAGIVGRLLWGWWGGRFERPTTAMLLISAIAVLSVVSLVASSRLPDIFAWLGSVGIGLSLFAWHSVSWLIIVNKVELGVVGKASGVLQTGTSLGFAAGPPTAGILIERTQSFTPSWIVASVLAGIGLILTARFRAKSGF